MVRQVAEEELNQAVYDELRRVAKKGDHAHYGEIAPRANVEPHDPRLFKILGDISAFEVQHERPMLSVVVLRKEDHWPGDGFFKLARELYPDGRSDDREAFYSKTLTDVYTCWENAK